MLNKYSKEKQIKIREKFDKIFTEIISDVLTEGLDADEIKEVFRIGNELYKRKKEFLRKEKAKYDPINKKVKD